MRSHYFVSHIGSRADWYVNAGVSKKLSDCVSRSRNTVSQTKLIITAIKTSNFRVSIVALALS